MDNMIKRVILIVLDSVGCGNAPDAANYGDVGSNTLANIAKSVGGLNLPNMGKLGLGNLTDISGVPPEENTDGAYGRLTEQSSGKDTTTGHWELAGLILDKPFPTYPNGFPDEIMSQFEKLIGVGTLGNYPASGTEIIKDLGLEHLQTGKPIIYTSADSVFQIAAHIDIIPLDKLYQFCEIAREILQGEHCVGRVIARPFTGKPGGFIRTEDRKDFSVVPSKDTVLDVIKAAGLDVIGIGKINDIFANRGLTQVDHTGNNSDGIISIKKFLSTPFQGLLFANLVDFDALYGHRNDPKGYAKALEYFDTNLKSILGLLTDTDILMITADHGNDPTAPGTDHTRERVPILIAGNPVKHNFNLGTRDGFADIAATIADMLGVHWTGNGQSFAKLILNDHPSR